jgi:hypothetical protein
MATATTKEEVKKEEMSKEELKEMEEAPYGRRKDGSPAAKPGRKPKDEKTTQTKTKKTKQSKTKKKRGPGRPKKTRQKAKGGQRKKVTTRTRKGPGRPKKTRVQVKNPKELVKLWEDLEKQQKAAKEASEKMLQDLANELTQTTDNKRESEIMKQMKKIKSHIQ